MLPFSHVRPAIGALGAANYAESRCGRRWAGNSMLTHANHVGLFAEQIGQAGEALGNFPQAFTHLALISAATNLDRALSGEPPP